MRIQEVPMSPIYDEIQETVAQIRRRTDFAPDVGIVRRVWDRTGLVDELESFHRPTAAGSVPSLTASDKSTLRSEPAKKVPGILPFRQRSAHRM